MPVYGGITYITYIGGRGKDRNRRIRLESDVEAHYASLGANLNLLNDIGNQNPEKVMEKFLASVSKKEGKEK